MFRKAGEELSTLWEILHVDSLSYAVILTINNDHTSIAVYRGHIMNGFIHMS